METCVFLLSPSGICWPTPHIWFNAPEIIKFKRSRDGKQKEAPLDELCFSPSSPHLSKCHHHPLSFSEPWGLSCLFNLPSHFTSNPSALALHPESDHFFSSPLVLPKFKPLSSAFLEHWVNLLRVFSILFLIPDSLLSHSSHSDVWKNIPLSEPSTDCTSG